MSVCVCLCLLVQQEKPKKVIYVTNTHRNVETHLMFSVKILISSQNLIDKAFPLFLLNKKACGKPKKRKNGKKMPLSRHFSLPEMLLENIRKD